MIIRNILLALTIAAVSAGALAAPQTLTGVITDDMCGAKHTMMPGKPDAECVRACAKAGIKYALVAGNKVYVLQGDSKQFDALAGKKAKVTGEVNGTTLKVSGITPAN